MSGPDRRNGPDPLDEWERGFDAGWAARLAGRRVFRFRKLIPPRPDSYRAGWLEGWRTAGADE